ncbi:MAG TPA: polyprenyl diphosphate synthase [Candidatus Thermoplasmatota archaeon]|jgi:tritrans,polycis-undecaprenyl-diphosphate synthase [geranylgeranyl-diphosphate specific]|nr:polyprenyl diphosphate synthase [Candidatus Thermoplasmatota archaeon]
MVDLGGALSDAVARSVEKALLAEVLREPVPRHVAIIMDGNRRFAQSQGLDPWRGHEMGRDTLENVLDWCLETGVRYLTVYAFSTENFRRNLLEVQLLMKLFEDNFRKMAEDERVHQHKIRVRAIGQIDLLPPSVREAIAYAEKRTADYDQYFFQVALAYGGRQEILHAIQRIAHEVEAGKLRPDEIDEATVSQHLFTSDLPDPDLILRTSGEERISNFLLWQVAYAELLFVDVLWPRFKKIDFLRALRTHQQRQRRYGE